MHTNIKFHCPTRCFLFSISNFFLTNWFPPKKGPTKTHQNLHQIGRATKRPADFSSPTSKVEVDGKGEVSLVPLKEASWQPSGSAKKNDLFIKSISDGLEPKLDTIVIIYIVIIL